MRGWGRALSRGVSALIMLAVIAAIVAGMALLVGAFQVPYDLAERPLPTGPTLDALLPLEVGPFLREDARYVEGMWTAIYRRGEAQVGMQAVRDASAAEAQARVAEVERQPEVRSRLHRSRIGFDPSYLCVIMGDGRARLAWSHGPFFFDAQADSETTLEAFVARFPY